MEEKHRLLNRFLVEVFNEILKTEEACVKDSGFKNLSLREMHVIEAVCRAENEKSDNRASAIAIALRVTAGTLTTTTALLEKKGYLLRKRDEMDKRIVRISSTPLGWKANECHEKFHSEMVKSVVSTLTEEKLDVFILALDDIRKFFNDIAD